MAEIPAKAVQVYDPLWDLAMPKLTKVVNDGGQSTPRFQISGAAAISSTVCTERAE